MHSPVDNITLHLNIKSEIKRFYVKIACRHNCTYLAVSWSAILSIIKAYAFFMFLLFHTVQSPTRPDCTLCFKPGFNFLPGQTNLNLHIQSHLLLKNSNFPNFIFQLTNGENQSAFRIECKITKKGKLVN